MHRFYYNPPRYAVTTDSSRVLLGCRYNCPCVCHSGVNLEQIPNIRGPARGPVFNPESSLGPVVYNANPMPDLTSVLVQTHMVLEPVDLENLSSNIQAEPPRIYPSYQITRDAPMPNVHYMAGFYRYQCLFWKLMSFDTDSDGFQVWGLRTLPLWDINFFACPMNSPLYF